MRRRRLEKFLGVVLAGLLVVAILDGCSDDATSNPTDSGLVQLEAGSDHDVVATVVDGGDGGPSDDSGPVPPGAISGLRDRDGRPWVSLLLVRAANAESYNVESVDQVDPSTYGADFQEALVLLDHLDGVDDWAGGDADAGADDAGVYPHPLTNAWLGADALVVDPNMPFSATSYLDVEVNGDAHATCGGRWLGDDTLDKTMSYLVKRQLTGIGDGVSAPAKPATLTFPYLAEPF